MKKLILLFAILFSTTAFAQSNDEVLNNASVVNLYSKGLGTIIIVSKIKTSKTNFDVSVDALLKLKAKKMPDEILNAMVEASGNKENATGDINDPNAIHESGIYYSKMKEGKQELTVLEPTVCAQSKWGSGILTSLTYGIAKTKMKAKLDGGKSRTQLNESNPVFYFYFEKKQNLDNSSTWFAAATSPNEFLLVKMDAKEKSREFVTGSYGAYSGISWGVDEKYKVDFAIEKLKSGVYKVTTKANLVSGEYCFIYAGNTSFFGTTGQGKVFDFEIR